jgi:hypothetical protein
MSRPKLPVCSVMLAVMMLASAGAQRVRPSPCPVMQHQDDIDEAIQLAIESAPTVIPSPWTVTSHKTPHAYTRSLQLIRNEQRARVIVVYLQTPEAAKHDLECFARSFPTRAFWPTDHVFGDETYINHPPLAYSHSAQATDAFVWREPTNGPTTILFRVGRVAFHLSVEAGEGALTSAREIAKVLAGAVNRMPH